MFRDLLPSGMWRVSCTCVLLTLAQALRCAYLGMPPLGLNVAAGWPLGALQEALWGAHSEGSARTPVRRLMGETARKGMQL